MQFRSQGPPPPAVIYLTTMSRPDAALALALLLAYEAKRQARVAAIAVNDAGLDAAVFCDLLIHYYAAGAPAANSNRLLPVGLVAANPMPANPPMLQKAVERRDEKGAFVYNRAVKRIADTSEVAAMIRNSLTGMPNGTVSIVLSAPAKDLVRALDLPSTRESIAVKVKSLIVCEEGTAKDPESLKRVLAGWPTPIVHCSRALGESLKFPASSIEKDFAWAQTHPLVDIYTAFQKMPYDAPASDMAAMLYAIDPKLFELTGNSIGVSESGKAAVLKAFTETVSAKPVPRQFGFRPPQNAKAEVKK
ncbi:MAG: hypothetical protein HYZ37_07075 [Candidatus Solibacter usitatus]|nr:hypothetical protein [Candidatus Solibacter usitatus]